jgi:hypothetical protein
VTTRVCASVYQDRAHDHWVEPCERLLRRSLARRDLGDGSPFCLGALDVEHTPISHGHLVDPSQIPTSTPFHCIFADVERGGLGLGRSDQLLSSLAFPALQSFDSWCSAKRAGVLHAGRAVGSILIERESLVAVPVAKMLAHSVVCLGGLARTVHSKVHSSGTVLSRYRSALVVTMSMLVTRAFVDLVSPLVLGPLVGPLVGLLVGPLVGLLVNPLVGYWWVLSAELGGAGLVTMSGSWYGTIQNAVL